MGKFKAVVLATALATSAALVTPISQAGAMPDDGWFPTAFVRSAAPLFTYRAQPGAAHTDRGVTPTLLRVDDKLANPLGRYYLWSWAHGAANAPGQGGGLFLLTADNLDGPWTDRGRVTPEVMLPPSPLTPGRWQTGGDIIWSERYQKFFTVPHTVPMHSYLLESTDGVAWAVSAVAQPVLSMGPGYYDQGETGYGRLILDPANGPGDEKWIWLYRSGVFCGACSASNNGEYYTLAVATADDIYGPWTKAADNPVFDPFTDRTLAPGGDLIGLNSLVHYKGQFQMVWQESFGLLRLARSPNLRNWEDWIGPGPTAAVMGHNGGVPFFVGGSPEAVVITGANVFYDDIANQWVLIYTGWDALQLTGTPAAPGSVSINLARAVAP
jgi:hypothetical protein